ncbi:hypothetical protein TWF481_009383 [Arthrobotrys musiformis]|uniref:Clr5 domain-containing protein n=1 Tax=Arthrobotrys musiformis TaxID=47236 RepID=A0AAV9W3L6_9PEZI
MSLPIIPFNPETQRLPRRYKTPKLTNDQKDILKTYTSEINSRALGSRQTLVDWLNSRPEVLKDGKRFTYDQIRNYQEKTKTSSQSANTAQSEITGESTSGNTPMHLDNRVIEAELTGSNPQRRKALVYTFDSGSERHKRQKPNQGRKDFNLDTIEDIHGTPRGNSSLEIPLSSVAKAGALEIPLDIDSTSVGNILPGTGQAQALSLKDLTNEALLMSLNLVHDDGSRGKISEWLYQRALLLLAAVEDRGQGNIYLSSDLGSYEYDVSTFLAALGSFLEKESGFQTSFKQQEETNNQRFYLEDLTGKLHLEDVETIQPEKLPTLGVLFGMIRRKYAYINRRTETTDIGLAREPSGNSGAETTQYPRNYCLLVRLRNSHVKDSQKRMGKITEMIIRYQLKSTERNKNHNGLSPEEEGGDRPFIGINTDTSKSVPAKRLDITIVQLRGMPFTPPILINIRVYQRVEYDAHAKGIYAYPEEFTGPGGPRNREGSWLHEISPEIMEGIEVDEGSPVPGLTTPRSENLLVAVRNGRMEEVQENLSNGTWNIYTCSHTGRTALWYALEGQYLGKSKMVEFLLENGLDVSSEDDQGVHLNYAFLVNTWRSVEGSRKVMEDRIATVRVLANAGFDIMYHLAFSLFYFTYEEFDLLASEENLYSFGHFASPNTQIPIFSRPIERLQVELSQTIDPGGQIRREGDPFMKGKLERYLRRAKDLPEKFDLLVARGFGTEITPNALLSLVNGLLQFETTARDIDVSYIVTSICIQLLDLAGDFIPSCLREGGGIMGTNISTALPNPRVLLEGEAVEWIHRINLTASQWNNQSIWYSAMTCCKAGYKKSEVQGIGARYVTMGLTAYDAYLEAQPTPSPSDGYFCRTGGYPEYEMVSEPDFIEFAEAGSPSSSATLATLPD